MKIKSQKHMWQIIAEQLKVEYKIENQHIQHLFIIKEPHLIINKKKRKLITQMHNLI